MAEVAEREPASSEPAAAVVEAADGGVSAPAETVDDLFGDDDEEDSDDAAPTQNTRKRMNIEANSDDSDNDADLFGDEDDEEVPAPAEEPEQEEEEVSIKNITLCRHPLSHDQPSEGGISFPLPRFLSVDAAPFQPEEFEEYVESLTNDNTNGGQQQMDESLKNSYQFQKLELMNTVRWRYAKSSSGSLHKQSNTQIIEWEDGSQSLKIGQEYFDIKFKANDDDILTFANESEENTMMGYLPLEKSIQIVPPSTKSKAHKLLAMTIKSGMKAKKAKKINTIVTNEDPEAKAREVERAQREIEKARRRQAQKAEMEEMEMEMERRREGSNNGGYSIEAEDADEDDEDYGAEEGGFVVADGDEEDESEMDDDELDRAAEKLKQVKRDGARKYAETHQNGEDEEEEEEEAGVMRKKRRVVLDDEDED